MYMPYRALSHSKKQSFFQKSSSQSYQVEAIEVEEIFVTLGGALLR